MAILIENLKALRNANKLTQNDVAEHLKISLQTYNKFENEKVASQPTPDHLIALGDLFNISIDELVGREFSADGSTMKKLRVRLEIEKEIDDMFDEVIKAKRKQVIEDTLRKLKDYWLQRPFFFWEQERSLLNLQVVIIIIYF